MTGENDEMNKSSVDLACQAGAAKEIVDRFGSATKEHIVGYVGKDNETGIKLRRGLKDISKSKVNTEYSTQNLRQQSGFAAENKYVARENAEYIIDGAKSRISRTDDLGRVNDPLFDHVIIDEKGVEIIGSGEQMKFVGSSSKECLGLLKSKRYNKYIEADAKLTVPSDYYADIKFQIDADIAKVSKQLERAEKTGNVELKIKKEKEIIKLNQIRKNLKDSGITNKEALEARLHPLLSTAKDIGRISHRAGLQQAKTGAIISGVISLISNLVCLCKGEKTVEHAAKDLSFDIAGGSLMGYLTAFNGSAIKGVMQNSNGKMIQSLSKTNLPSTIVTASIDLGRSIVSYMRGEISVLECLSELGEKGTSNLSAALFAGLGQVAIPIPIVGTMVGSMMGYILGLSVYKELLSALNDESISCELRLSAERESKEAIEMIKCYRREMYDSLERNFEDLRLTFVMAFSTIDKALLCGNTDDFIKGVNSITLKLGGQVLFNSQTECEEFMINDAPFVL